MAGMIRVRCNECEQTFSLHTTRKSGFVVGSSIGISCKDIKAVYPKAQGCDKALVFVRRQGIRELKELDISLERIKDDLEGTKTRDEKTGNSGQ